MSRNPRGVWIAGAAAVAGLLTLVAAAGAGHARADQIAREVTFLSKTYTVDKIYKSMLGPMSSTVVYLSDAPEPELLWVTAFKVTVVGEDGRAPVSQEFMCHTNLDLNMRLHKQLFALERDTPSRLFSLSQGQQEIVFPEGFGVPVLSSEPFALTSQVLNHNIVGPPFNVRHRVTVTYVRDKDLKKPLKPLFQASANALVLLDGKDGYFDIPEPDPNVHGSSCLPGQSAVKDDRIFNDPYGRKFSAHWVVPPGKHEYRTNTTRFMRIPYDTTAHFMAVHLHPFARTLELRDITASKTIFTATAANPEGKVGLTHVDHFASAEGIPIYKDHQYELSGLYDNTSGVNQDSMAVMFLYLLDKEFKRPAL